MRICNIHEPYSILIMQNNKNLPSKPEKSRIGRENQRFSSESGARMVAGCICLNETKDKVIMVSSSAHKGQWVFPKGGIEIDEGDDFVISALRETWEEAGCEGRVLAKLPVILDTRGRKASNLILKEQAKNCNLENTVPRSELHFYELLVESLSNEWPESSSRKRRWCTYSEAKNELLKAKRPELVHALELSRLVKKKEGIDEKDEH